MAKQTRESMPSFWGNRYLIVRKKFEEYMDALKMGEEEEAE